MTASLFDLLTPRTKDDEVQSLLSTLQDKNFPVSDWEVGGAGRTMTEAIGYSLADHASLIATVAAGGFLELAAALSEPTWLDLIAENFYSLARARATFTKQAVKIKCDAGFGPLVINPGFTVRTNGSPGNRYIYQGAPVTIVDGGSVTIEFTAEEAGSRYADPADTIVNMVTPLPGLSVDNPAPPFGGLTGPTASKNPANQGSGAVTPSAPGTPPVRKRYYTLTVIESGAAPSSGTIQIDWLENGVKSTDRRSPIPATYTGIGDGITLTFSNGVGAGFVQGDMHTFSTPGSPITVNGVDDESNTSLAARCRGRWPSLGLNIVPAKYEAWIRQASADNAYGIEKITIRPSGTVAGQTNIMVATATGAPSSGVLASLQSYVNARDGITDSALVAGAVDQEVTMGGNVTVPAGLLQAAQEAADLAWIAYIRALPIGGDTATGLPGVVRLSALTKIVMDAGCVDYDFLTLFGAPGNMQLDANQVAVIGAGDLPSEALVWQTVG